MNSVANVPNRAEYRDFSLPANPILMPQKIQPVRADGNLLLCTLLLGNVSVNALLSIVMAKLTSGLVGFALATVIITIFGEIIPQVFTSEKLQRRPDDENWR